MVCFWFSRCEKRRKLPIEAWQLIFFETLSRPENHPQFKDDANIWVTGLMALTSSHKRNQFRGSSNYLNVLFSRYPFLS
jgi:hypothetical protein